MLARAVTAAILALCAGSAAAEAARTATFEARVQLPPSATGAASAASTASLVVTGPDGGTAHAYVDRSGRVIVPALSAGAHLVDVAALGYVFHQYRLDVRPGAAGSPFALSTVGGAAPLPPPYTLVPIGHASYYVKRKPVNLRGLILSPYGLMAVVALFAIVAGPAMKVDPEEMKAMREEMKDSPLSFLMGGAAPAGGSDAAAEQPALATSSARRIGGAGASSAGSGGRKRR